MAKEIFGANLKMYPVVEGYGEIDNSTHIVTSPSDRAVVDLLSSYVYKGIAGGRKKDGRGCIVGGKDKEIIVFIPFMFLDGLTSIGMLRKNESKLGAQDVGEYASGAHTRETSPVWLNNLNINDVLVGHSEVRDEYEKLMDSCGNTGHREPIDELFSRKIANALKYGLRVTYCVGETEEEKKGGLTYRVLERQIKVGLKSIGPTGLNQIIMAYEPRWSIGGDKPTPTTTEIKKAHAAIREFLKIYCGVSNPDCVPILYGGSMKPENAAQIMGIKGVDGGLIGSASLDAEKFAKIVNYDRQA